MKATTKSFLVGCVLGAVLMALLPIGALGVSYYFFREAVIGGLASTRAETLRVPPIAAGQVAAYDWTVNDLEGGAVSLEAARGKVLFLHYWSPECAICLAEIPSINRLYQELKDLPVAFYCVASNPNGIDLNLTALEYGLEFPIYVFGGEKPAVFGSGNAPVTWIAGMDGGVVFKHEGGAKWDDAATVAYLKGLAAAAAVPE